MANLTAIARALGGKKCGGGFACRCPAHYDRKPSLSIRQDGEPILVHCHAGCTQQDVITALKDLGLWPEKLLAHETRPINNPDNRQLALRIFLEGEELRGKAAGIYLVTRGLAVPDTPRLKHHPALWHSGARENFPGLVAAFTDVNGRFCGITRIFLSRDQRGCICKAPVEPVKMSLGSIRGGSVRLADYVAGKPLILAEGIETALACMEATGWPAWAAGGASNIAAIELPEKIRDVMIAADGDGAGEKAAQAAAARLLSEGRKVRIARPPKEMDFLDVATAPRNEAAS